MFCKKCGKELSDNAKFCPACGTRMNADLEKQVNNNAVRKMEPKAFEQENAKPKKKNQKNTGNKAIMVILLILLIILVLAIGGLSYYYFVCVKGGKELKLFNFLKFDRYSTIEQLDESLEDEIETNEQETSEEIGSIKDETAEEAIGDGDEVVSTTNEVINSVVLTDIPKAIYSYSFDESLGGAKAVIRKDDSTQNNTGTFPTTVDDSRAIYTSGIEGKAIYLDGTYGIQLSDMKKVGETYTIGFWMKAENFCDWSPFIQIGSDFLDSKGMRNYIALNQKTDGNPTSPIFNSVQNQYGNSFEIRPDSSDMNCMDTNIWYYIVLVVDGNKSGTSAHTVEGKLYVAGNLVGSGNVAMGALNNDDLTAYLGINCWDKLFSVYFDEVKVWNQVLGENQINTLYQAYVQ